MKNSNSSFFKFVKVCVGVVKVGVKQYSSKFSKKTYTQIQLMCVVCLMKRMKMHYRDIVELLEDMPEICELLELQTIPHFTTLQKFVMRTQSGILELILNRTALLFCSSGNVGIDGTGYAQRHASTYYTKRVELRKTFLKHNICIDTTAQCIITSTSTNSRHHESLDFPVLLSRTNRIVKPKYVVADKGYDSVKNREFAKLLKITPVIPYREANEVLALANFSIDKSVYHQRSKVETVNSVMKKKFDDTIHSKNFGNQKKEAKILDIVYNLYRYVKISTIYLLRISTKPFFSLKYFSII